MNLHYGAASLLAIGAALSAGQAMAIGLDRSNQDITAIFEEGNVAELSFGRVQPRLSGADRAPFLDSYDSVGGDFTTAGASVKMEFGNGLSGALIVDQPFGADIFYAGQDGVPAAGSAFAGTTARLDSRAITAVGRYRLNENLSVHAGVRRQTIDADITLSGAAYGPLSGYQVTLDESSATGYLIGAAYEIPAIALRAALTYNTAIEHEFDKVESVPAPLQAGFALPPRVPGTTEVETPESWNLDLQTGVAPDTLAFANIRYAAYEDTRLSPQVFAGATGGASLTNIDDNYQVQIGVGRRFSDMFSGQVAVGFEPEGDDVISPLDPTNGKRWIGLGGAYSLDAITVSGGVRYTMLGDASPQTAGTERADFTDNSAVAVGMSVAYRF